MLGHRKAGTSSIGQDLSIGCVPSMFTTVMLSLALALSSLNSRARSLTDWVTKALVSEHTKVCNVHLTSTWDTRAPNKWHRMDWPHLPLRTLDHTLSSQICSGFVESMCKPDVCCSFAL